MKKPVECLVCGELHTTGDFTADYKGRRIPLCSQACLAEFQQLERAGALDKATGKIEPRAALFQADSNPKPQLSQAYFLTGLYLLLGLACGGLASYLAVQKGQSGWPAFALGLGLNVLGLALVWLKPKRAMMFTSKGLSKIPSTRDELLCGSCGHPNHPSARACNVCRAPLNPVAPSEVSLAGLHKESRE